MSSELYFCFNDQSQMSTHVPNPFSRHADPQSFPVNLESSDHHSIHFSEYPSFSHPECGSFFHHPENQNLYYMWTFIFHCPHFMGTAFLSGALKSFHSGPFVLCSAISGPILTQFSLSYIPSLLVAPKIHILTMHLLLG